MHATAQAATERPQLARDVRSPCPRSQSAADWRLTEEKQFFLHDPPNSFTGVYRSQGIATDGRRWFFSWQYGLEIADESFHSSAAQLIFPAAKNLVPGIPASLFARGLDHIGDIDYHNGIIYASLDTTRGYTDGHVALYSASDLRFTGTVFDLEVASPANPKKDLASWVAVDAARNRGLGKEWQTRQYPQRLQTQRLALSTHR